MRQFPPHPGVPDRAIDSKVAKDAGATALARGAAALRDHWWVQWLSPQGWEDLDPLGDARGTAPEALDSALYHRVVIRLVTERASSSGLSPGRAFRSLSLEEGQRSGRHRAGVSM